MGLRRFVSNLAVTSLAMGLFFVTAAYLLTRICTTYYGTVSSTTCIEYGWGLAPYVLPVGFVFLGLAAILYASRDAVDE
jgi:hypothetical protein